MSFMGDFELKLDFLNDWAKQAITGRTGSSEQGLKIELTIESAEVWV